MISSKTIKFITQTKLHCETIWRTSMVLSRKHAVILYSYSISFFFFFAIVNKNWRCYRNLLCRTSPSKPVTTALLNRSIYNGLIASSKSFLFSIWLLLIQFLIRYIIELIFIDWLLDSCHGLFYMWRSQSDVPRLDGYSYAIPSSSVLVTCQFKYLINYPIMIQFKKKKDKKKERRKN